MCTNKVRLKNDIGAFNNEFLLLAAYALKAKQIEDMQIIKTIFIALLKIQLTI